MDLPDAGAADTRGGRRRGVAVAESRLAANKKRAADSGSPLVFSDESGFMLQPVRRRTWAPSGQTPIQRAWDRHDRLSAVGFIGVSPVRRRLLLFFHLIPENVDSHHLIWLLRLMHRHYRRHVVLVWDRWNVHRSVAGYFEQHHPDWFTFEWLPAYSPKLNPVEQCWNHTKYSDIPNFIPDDLDHLDKAVDASITQQSKNSVLLRSFFAYANLSLSVH
jgi:transposase